MMMKKTHHAWAQAYGVNVIPEEDDGDNLVAPVADDSEDEEDEEDDDDTVVYPMSATNKTLCAMQQLSTFYNPIATNYIQNNISNDDTVTTSNQLGREEADVTNPDPDDDNSDASLKRHVLQEDNSETSSKTHDRKEDHFSSMTSGTCNLEEDHLQNEQASAAIDYLPNFAFYTRNQVLMPAASETKTLNFEDAFEHHMLEPTTFDEAYSHEDPKQHAKWHTAIRKEFKDMNNCGVWCKVKWFVIPQGWHCIKSKLVFKIKRDGVF